MITTRTARQCGQADYGWLQARYTFSFGHYFDPKLLGYASLRVLNQEVLAPGAAFQPRTYPKVDILNVILDGEAEYRDSEGNHVQASAGETLLLSTQPGISYSEHNLSKDKPLTRMQLWLDACPQRENPLIQKLALNMGKQQLIASPEGTVGSLQLRQPVKPVVAKEPARTAKNFGYEEMLSELEAIVADAETRLAEDEATA